MAKGDIGADKAKIGGSSYPPPHDQKLKGRKTWPLTSQWGLSQFGVNRVELPAGGWSTNRHWHSRNDELVVVISGELTVVTDDGEEVLGPGDTIGFKAGVENAHHLQNRGSEPAVYFDVGGRDAWDRSTFPDIGMEARTMMNIEFRPIKAKP
jgi:uncharacterized cupin superfamily protein